MAIAVRLSQCGNSTDARRHLQKGINGVHCAGSRLEPHWGSGLRIFGCIRFLFHSFPRRARGRWVLLTISLLAPDMLIHGANAGEQPLVPLSAIDPSIRQEVRYATGKNFTGRRVPGYDAAECWLKPVAARALAKVQADLIAEHPDLSLKVFDCYRPRRAVQAFVAWAGTEDDGSTRHYYPNLSRGALLERGYIGRSSSHSKGIAVDLTLVRRAGSNSDRATLHTAGVGAETSTAVACTQSSDQAIDANSLDMGTTFDCFDRKSHTDAAGLSVEQRSARRMLTRFMQRHGFQNYSKEWWHFTYDAGDDGRTFDLPVTEAPRRVQPPPGKSPQP